MHKPLRGTGQLLFVESVKLDNATDELEADKVGVMRNISAEEVAEISDVAIFLEGVRTEAERKRMQIPSVLVEHMVREGLEALPKTDAVAVVQGTSVVAISTTKDKLNKMLPPGEWSKPILYGSEQWQIMRRETGRLVNANKAQEIVIQKFETNQTETAQ